jgi:rhodanese-related sulfurtransferase
LIDVREHDEVAMGSIPSAVNVPLSELGDALDQSSSQGAFNRVRLTHPGGV